MKREVDQKAFINILDCMACTDGGPRLVMFQAFLGDMSDRAYDGDPAAAEILDIMQHFSNMIDVANKRG